MRFGKSPADVNYSRKHINNVVDFRRKQIQVSALKNGMAPSGAHISIINNWRTYRDRSHHNYNLYSRPVLLAMWSIAEEEIYRQTGQAQEAAKVWSGYNAIKEVLEVRGNEGEKG